MNTDKLRRRQNLKVIISEAIMVLVIIATVAVLALVVSGYWLNADFEVERQGMLQISSVPSGANLVIDGEDPSWFQRTNTSKILASGEHEIRLTKDGYDSWSRTINISEGLLYRIHYPRLFLLERESTPVLNTAKFTFATVSPDAKTLLLLGDTTEWALVNLDSDQPKFESLDVSALFAEKSILPSDATAAESAEPSVFAGEILDASWDTNSEHVLFKIRDHEQIIWALVDIMNVKNSLNLTREFGASFSYIKIYDHSAGTLLALENGNLRKIDTRNKTLSATLVKDVSSFDYYDNEIIFSATRAIATHDEAEINDVVSAEESPESSADASAGSSANSASANPYYLGYFKLGSSDVQELASFPEPFKLAIMQFYDDKFIAILVNDELTVYDKLDFTKSSTYKLSFAPASLEVGHQGEFITLRGDGNLLATLDMEDKSLREWTVDGSSFGWLTTDMLFSVKNGELFVYDFDGLNRRSLAVNVSSHFPATITADKWLYYFSDGSLVREVVAK